MKQHIQPYLLSLLLTHLREAWNAGSYPGLGERRRKFVALIRFWKVMKKGRNA